MNSVLIRGINFNSVCWLPTTKYVQTFAAACSSAIFSSSLQELPFLRVLGGCLTERCFWDSVLTSLLAEERDCRALYICGKGGVDLGYNDRIGRKYAAKSGKKVVCGSGIKIIFAFQ